MVQFRDPQTWIERLGSSEEGRIAGPVGLDGRNANRIPDGQVKDALPEFCTCGTHFLQNSRPAGRQWQHQQADQLHLLAAPRDNRSSTNRLAAEEQHKALAGLALAGHWLGQGPAATLLAPEAQQPDWLG